MTANMRRRRRRINDHHHQCMIRNTNQFASNFSYYGCMGSIVAIAIIAVCCQLVDYSEIIDHPNYKPNSKSHNNRRRRMQELNDYDEDGSHPCGDIFMHVKNDLGNANNYSRTWCTE